jgi:hypothetical protein
LCAGSLENTQWTTFTASGTTNIVLTGSNISCTGGGCGFQFGIFSAGVGGSCCGALTHLGCYGNKVCTGGQATAGPTNPAGRLTWNATGAGGFTVTITGVSTGEVFCFIMDGNADADCQYTLTASGILPISIQQFEGVKQEDNVKLSWVTLTEKNSTYFEIQRSSNGQDFEPIGELASVSNSTTQQAYSYFDQDPRPGINFYRLVEHDAGGSTIMSKTVEVVMDLEELLVMIGNGDISLSWGNEFSTESSVRIRVISSTGQMISDQTVSNNGSYKINTGNLSRGIYIVVVEGSKAVYKSRFVIE